MIQEKGRICTQILDKQGKIASLESDSCNLTQTLELIQQERVSLSCKLAEKRAYYMKVAEELQSKLQQQKVKDNFSEPSTETGGRSTVDHITVDSMSSNSRKNLMTDVDSAKMKLNEVTKMNSQIAEENSKVKHSIQELRCRAKEFKPEFLAMSINSLEQEQEATSSEKVGELEYLQSLQSQIEKLKGTSCMIKCACGKEFMMATDSNMNVNP
ncbi:hypothetical protein M5689_007551 [Euphorbia peplus]|nr:hypothetical protein M5689_007551 [Euphorbia peplus]